MVVLEVIQVQVQVKVDQLEQLEQPTQVVVEEVVLVRDKMLVVQVVQELLL